MTTKKKKRAVGRERKPIQQKNPGEFGKRKSSKQKGD